MNFLARFKSDPLVGRGTAAAPPHLLRRPVSRGGAGPRRRGPRRSAGARTMPPQQRPRQARAARLAASEEDAEEGAEPAPPAVPPMDWEEAVGWLSTRSAEARSLVAQRWNWEHDLRVLQFLVTQPDMDMGVAAGIFWVTGATDDFFPWGDDEHPEDPQFQRAAEIVQRSDAGSRRKTSPSSASASTTAGIAAGSRNGSRRSTSTAGSTGPRPICRRSRRARW